MQLRSQDDSEDMSPYSIKYSKQNKKCSKQKAVRPQQPYEPGTRQCSPITKPIQ